MSQRYQTRTLVGLILGLAVCLAVGFCTLHQYGISLAFQSARKEARDGLARLADELAHRLESADPRSDTFQTALRDACPAASGSSTERFAQAVVVDRNWRVLAGDGAAKGARLQWSPADQRPASLSDAATGAALAGTLELAKGPRLAVARKLGAGDAYLVVHRFADELPMSPATLSRCLLVAGTIAFPWTLGLSGFVVYLLVTRLGERFSQRLAESEALGLKKTESLVRMRDAIIFGLADLTESRDPETGHHLERISIYTPLLARALRRLPEFRETITPEFAELIGVSSVLHDIGKVGIEDAILLKPGRLTPEEFKQMQRHAAVGGECLVKIEQRLGSANFLRTAREIAYGHHERWDGSGYPNGLAGEDIPLAARIVALCDVYEALSTRRVYKEAWPHERCVEYIRDQAGKHFDPRIVEVFLRLEKQFRLIARQYDDDLVPQPGAAAAAPTSPSQAEAAPQTAFAGFEPPTSATGVES